MGRFSDAVKTAMVRKGATGSVEAFLEESSKLAADAYPGPSCLEPHELEYLMSGEDAAEDQARWREFSRHVEQCGDCRALVAQAADVPKCYSEVAAMAGRSAAVETPVLPSRMEDAGPFMMNAARCALEQIATVGRTIESSRTTIDELSRLTEALLKFSVTGDESTHAEDAYRRLSALLFPELSVSEPDRIAMLCPHDELGSVFRATACRLQISRGSEVLGELLAAFPIRQRVRIDSRIAASEARKLLSRIGHENNALTFGI